MQQRRGPLGLTVIGIAAIGIALTGCTPAAVEPPSVTWQSGEPSGELESSPWVQAVRASDTALSIAAFTRDYTSDALQDTTTEEAIDTAAQWQRDEAKADRFFTYPGPVPMIPLSVDEQGDEALVTVCQAKDWYLDADSTSAPELTEGREVVYRVISDGDSRLVETESVTTEECDISDASIALFDPQPDPTETYSPDDVKVP